MATHHRKKNNPGAPEISLRSEILEAFDELRCGVARRTASSFQGLPCLISVTQAEVNNLDILVVVE